MKYLESLDLFVILEKDVAQAKEAKKYIDRVNPQGARVMDCGASTGDYAKLCMEAGAANVWCYESDERYEEVLKANLKPYPHVEINIASLGVEPRYSYMAKCPGGPKTNFVEEFKRIDPNILKMDIEGYEFDCIDDHAVLAMIDSSLDNFIVEWHPAKYENRIDRLKTIHSQLTAQHFTPNRELPETYSGWPFMIYYYRGKQ